jgi:hypothetical protein
MNQVKHKLIRAIRNITIIFILVQLPGCEKAIPKSSVNVYYEQIPGSKNHSPNGTWWGYNQSKIVRYRTTASNVFHTFNTIKLIKDL